MLRVVLHRLFWFLALAAVVVTAPSSAAAQERGQLFVEVLDGSGQPVTDLTPADFTVMEDDVEAEVVSAEPGTAPMKIALLVDNGDRINEASALNPLRAGLDAFLETLAPQHEIGLFTIGRNIQRRVDFTTDRDELRKETGTIFGDTGGGTVLLDGVKETWERRYDEDDAYPVFVLVLTDGTESSGHYDDDDYTELVTELVTRGVTIHAVVLSSRGGSDVTTYGLNLTQNTGGAYEAIVAATGLEASLRELASRIGAHYAEVSTRYRVVYERPDPAGARISMSVARSGVGVRVFADRRLPEQ